MAEDGKWLVADGTVAVRVYLVSLVPLVSGHTEFPPLSTFRLPQRDNKEV